MIGAIQSALSGLQFASVKAQTAASNIANVGTPAGDNVDLSENAVNLITAGVAYKANAATIRTVDAMQDDLLKAFDQKV